MTDLADGGPLLPDTIATGMGAEAVRAGLFLCIGAVGFAVDVALFSGLSGAGLPPSVARLASMAAATGVTYGLNRGLTFAAGSPPSGREFGRYALVTLCAQGISYAAFLALVSAALPPLAALAAGAAGAAALSFTGQRLFTFRGA